jgi:hypothetical protein
MPEIDVAILTCQDISDPQTGMAFLKRLCVMPSFIPQKYGNYEPIRTPFTPETMDVAVANSWGKSPFLWTRKKPQHLGRVWFGQPNVPHLHSSVMLQAAPVVETVASLTAWVQREAQELQCDLAYVHLEHTDRPLSQTDPEYSAVSGYTTHELVKCLPGLPWVTIFGLPYIRLFGRSTLLSAPCPVVQEVGSDHIMLQLTSSVTEVLVDHALVEAVQHRVIQHLGPKAFFDSRKGWSGAYDTPTFALER